MSAENVTETRTPANSLNALRLAMLTNGYRPVPLEGKRPARGMVDWPALAAQSTAEDVGGWATAYPAASNTGILTGEVVGIDVDVLTKPVVDRIEAAAREVLGPTTLKRYGQRPKLLLLYRTEAPFLKIQSPALLFGDGVKAQVEVMGTGQQVAVAGVHPGTGQPYLWDGPSPATVPLAALPVVTEAACREFVTRAEAILRAAGAVNQPARTAAVRPRPAVLEQGGSPRARTQAAVEHELTALARKLAHVDASPYDNWWRVAAALRAEFSDEPDAFGLFDQWSARCPEKYGSAECRRKWAEVADVEGIGLGIIHELAVAGGWVAPTRPTVRINACNISPTVDELEEVLRGTGEVFQRAGDLVVVRLVPVKLVDDTTDHLPRFVRPAPDWLLETAGKVADWESWSRNVWRRCPPSRDAVNTLLARQTWKFPLVSGLVAAPTLRPDGTVLAEEGFDAATGLFLHFNRQRFPAIPERPSRDEAAAALAVLGDLLVESPFVGPADRSVALSFLLTCLVRPTLPTAPLHAFSATTAGTGKSWIIDLGALIASGHVAPVMAQGKVKEELEKKLTAAAIEGSPIISIDNCERPLDGDLLCQMVTQQTVKVRVLGQSRNIDCPVVAAMAANGNNLVIYGDMTRRTLLCTLDARLERPELRAFKSDGHDIVRRDRGQFVAAGLTVLRGFIAAGRPKGPQPLGSFKEWSRLVRDALIWLGEADPADTMEKAREEDPQLVQLRTVMEQWELVVKDKSITVSELIERAASTKTESSFDPRSAKWSKPGDALCPEFREVLLEVAGAGGCVNGKNLGKWLSRNKGRIVGGRRLEQAGKAHGGVVLWRLERV